MNAAVTANGAVASTTEITDARPMLPVSDRSLWDVAAQRRDEFAEIVKGVFELRGLIAWVRKSKPGEYPLAVTVECWKPVSESDVTSTFDRGTLSIRISVTPYYENPLNFSVEVERHGRKLAETFWQLSKHEVEELATYLIAGGAKPSFFKPRVSLAERIIGVFLPFVGNPPTNKLIAEARPNHWTLPTLLGWTGAALLVGFGLAAVDAMGSWYAPVENYVLGALLGGALLVVAAVLARRRPVFVAIPKQSSRTPRREFRVDSWHASVPGAGEQFAAFRERVFDALTRNDASIEAHRELHQNFTPRGFEERERLVLTKGQVTLHVHVYPFSNDAFVGWESYLNWNRWAEGNSVSSTVRDGSSVLYKSLDVGVHVPTDFDLIESEALAETCHRILTDEIKSFLKEREIEADLDFKIVRGDRSRALKEGDKSADK